MRLGVIDIGSHSATLRVVEASPGAAPVPVYRRKAPTGLAYTTGRDGTVSPEGVRDLVAAARVVADAARARQVTELLTFATSAVRDATNRDEMVAALRAGAGLEVGFLTAEEEARLTYFAAHRWYGWSAGPLLVVDIGGGSMEIAVGRDEDPTSAISLPLGAGRLTRSHLPDHPARKRDIRRLRSHVREVLAASVDRSQTTGRRYRAVATSRTLHQLAGFAGQWGGGGRAHRVRVLGRTDLETWIPRLAAMTPRQRAELPGVSAKRARQILAGAVVAATTMAALELDRVEICPWALPEGILLRRTALPPEPSALRRGRHLRAAELHHLDERRLARRHTGH